MKSKLERYKRAVAAGIARLRAFGLDYSLMAQTVEDAINSELNPATAYEEVPVERWECVSCGSIYDNNGEVPADDPLLQSKGWSYCNCSFGHGKAYTKLTGTLRRPLPRPVERSVEVEAEIADDRAPHYYSAGTIIGIAPFRDHPELHGKRVTLTATVVEEER